MLNEFIPLELLIPSLGSPRRVYFLYKQAAATGTRGARLRFAQYRRSMTRTQRREVEALFGPPVPRLKSA
jgi:hypothetical protein